MTSTLHPRVNSNASLNDFRIPSSSIIGVANGPGCGFIENIYLSSRNFAIFPILAQAETDTLRNLGILFITCHLESKRLAATVTIQTKTAHNW